MSGAMMGSSNRSDGADRDPCESKSFDERHGTTGSYHFDGGGGTGGGGSGGGSGGGGGGGGIVTGTATSSAGVGGGGVDMTAARQAKERDGLTREMLVAFYAK